MKRKFVLPLTLTAMLALTGCLPEEETTSSGETGSTVTITNGNGSGSDSGSDSSSGGSSGGSSSGSSCTGTSSDGSGDGYSLHSFNLMLAGHQSWLPGTYSDSLASESMPTITEASLLFRSDAELKVRFKVHSQPYPTAGEEYCYGRAVGQASDPYTYTKLRFRVHLRDVMCDTGWLIFVIRCYLCWICLD